MVKLPYATGMALPRFGLLLFLVSTLLTTGCGLFGAHTKVQVPQLLTPLAVANKASLMQEVNRLAAIKSIHGKVDIQFEDTSFASSGIAEKYRQVDGAITLQRPGQIYLIIQFTFVDIAQMASDGEHFSVAVLKGDDKYRRFVKGTNNAIYAKLDGDDSAVESKKVKQKTEKETVSALSNLRPQHLTDALMVRPITADDSLIYSQSQFFQEEPDNRLQAKKGTRIMRGYYLLEEFSQPTAGEARLLRRFWFDRVGGIRLARLQTFDERGFLITDVSYSNETPFGNTAQVTLPSRIELTRPQDQYKLSITYQDPASVELNKEFRPEAFVLENKWQLPEVDLDAQRIKKVTANH
ncbi:MAG: hypothetical protein QOH96_4214 [Blastocatellia bacterium]|jgi:hypothetical protein|nr:hypothetical protein [Blastocatellia bacterium]